MLMFSAAGIDPAGLLVGGFIDLKLEPVKLLLDPNLVEGSSC
jgi:hypothetical protein